MIFEILGKPSKEDLEFITNENAKDYVNSLEDSKDKLDTLIKYDNIHAVDLIRKLLTINPHKRITADEALRHPYFEKFFDEEDLRVFEDKIDFEFEN